MADKVNTATKGKIIVELVRLEEFDEQEQQAERAKEQIEQVIRRNPGRFTVINLSIIVNHNPALIDGLFFPAVVERWGRKSDDKGDISNVVLVCGAGGSNWNSSSPRIFTHRRLDNALFIASAGHGETGIWLMDHYSSYGDVFICAQWRVLGHYRGVSFAVPRVAATLAVLLAFLLEDGPRSPKQAIELIRQSAIPMPADGHYIRNMLGAGALVPGRLLDEDGQPTVSPSTSEAGPLIN